MPNSKQGDKMSEKKNRICSALISLLCLVMLLASVMPCSYSADEKTSVTLVCVQDSIKVQGMEWKIYRVGERRSDSFALIGEFEKYPVDMSELSAENIRCIAQTLESFIIGDHIEADAECFTDNDGKAVFNALDKGLYLAVAKNVTKEQWTYTASPLLFEVKEEGAEEEAFPKIYSAITLSGEVSSYTVKKIWVDNDDAYEARPVSVTVDLFKDGYLYDTVFLDEASDWQYCWDELDTNAEWRVVERNIPEKYTVLADYNSRQFVIRNSFVTDGGEYTETTADSVVTSTINTTSSIVTTTATNSELPQTGQLWWPLLPLVLSGMTLICIGMLSGKKNKEDEK